MSKVEGSPIVVAGDGLCGALTDFGVLVHEAKEVDAGDALDDAGNKRLCHDAMAHELEQGGKAEDFAGAYDAKN